MNVLQPISVLVAGMVLSLATARPALVSCSVALELVWCGRWAGPRRGPSVRVRAWRRRSAKTPRNDGVAPPLVTVAARVSLHGSANGKPARLTKIAGFLIILATLTGRDVSATEAANGPVNETGRRSLAIEAGLRTFSLGLDIQLQTRWGLVVGAGPGRSFGFSFGAYLAYHLPLSAHWALRPGVRANRLWWKTDICGSPTCTSDFLIVETAIRYRGASGFVFEYGLPLFGWLTVGPAAGETRPHLELYDIASTPALAIAASVLFGYAFDF